MRSPPRLQRRDAKEPLFFEADQLGGESSIFTRAVGAVRLRQGDLAMRADEITHHVARSIRVTEASWLEPYDFDAASAVLSATWLKNCRRS